MNPSLFSSVFPQHRFLRHVKLNKGKCKVQHVESKIEFQMEGEDKEFDLSAYEECLMVVAGHRLSIR